MKKHALAELVSANQRHCMMDKSVGTSIHELHLSCFSTPTDVTSLVYEPCLCIIAQGSKEVLLAGDCYRLDPAQSLLVSVDLPVDARVLEATTSNPYMGLRISLDPKVVGELLADGADLDSTCPSERGIAVTPIEPRFLDAVTRLVSLLDTPRDIRPLAPLVLRETTHRVLTGPQGSRLRQIALAGAPARLA
ncbi:MAG: AraC family transcriptional regulator [Planctomycetales bacterium]|nr:AraC family transcriptional regulator [Planctomycetales bacterium]